MHPQLKYMYITAQCQHQLIHFSYLVSSTGEVTEIHLSRFDYVRSCVSLAPLVSSQSPVRSAFLSCTVAHGTGGYLLVSSSTSALVEHVPESSTWSRHLS
ncbi:hypothetical protein BDR06DRAFT_191770 [Suillus hirtellus]|nr:hypothetical protein BDR06DRAFT_191770 [Suillus hirtellus]